jgi:hypothetical protein
MVFRAATCACELSAAPALYSPPGNLELDLPEGIRMNIETRRYRPLDPSPRTLRRRSASTALALGLMVGVVQAAPVVTYVATDLQDQSPGADLWRIAYFIGGTADALESVNLLFDSASYGSLMSGNAPPELLLLDTQPDPALLADGQVTATLLAGLGAPVTFTVDFNWAGVGSPGAQPYEYLDANFSVLGTGTTLSRDATSVPEPGMLPVMLGAAGLFTWLRRRKADSRC